MEEPKQAGATPEADKVQRLADEAVEAGRKFLDSDTGRKVADLGREGFAKAEALTERALGSESGRQASGIAKQAGERGKAFIGTELGKNVAAGAAIGAGAGLVLPFFGSVAGALIGAAAGYARVVLKK